MSLPVLEARGLTRTYRIAQGLFKPRVELFALANVSFTLSPGRTLGVVGESGCGKSTLARLITLVEPPTAGEFSLDGLPAAGAQGATLRQLRRTVQMVFQDPYGSLNPRKKVASILQEPLKINTTLNPGEREAAAREMMARVGLRPEHYGRYPHMFSGGQRQRIAVARALMLRPKVVVADEPLSALDISIQAQVLNLLMELQESFNLAYLFISHDLSVVRLIADEVLVMYLGRPVEQGARDDIFREPLHPYTRALLASTPRVDPSLRAKPFVLKGEPPSPINPPSGCAFRVRCPHAVPTCAESRPELADVGGRKVACHLAGQV
ncbi:MAG: dipeptide ABC transporter ATP-binding protein [Deltaproteobacteria bacterium]|nr:dipeptide ABC transporter ATP-binding protein [Deltaproteobacteria bacterium]